MAARVLRGVVTLGRSHIKAAVVPSVMPPMAAESSIVPRYVSPFLSAARSFHRVAKVYDIHVCTCGKSTAIARGPIFREEKLDEILLNCLTLSKSVQLLMKHQNKDVIKSWVKDQAKNVFPDVIVDAFYPVLKYGALIALVTSSVIVLRAENPEISVTEYPSVLNSVRFFTLRKAIEFHKERMETLSDEELMLVIVEVIRTLQKLSVMYFKNSELPKEASVKTEELDSLSEELFLAISEAVSFLQEACSLYINRMADGTKLPSTTPGKEGKQNVEEVDSLTEEELLVSVAQVAAILQHVTATYAKKVGAAHINRKLPPATPGRLQS